MHTPHKRQSPSGGCRSRFGRSLATLAQSAARRQSTAKRASVTKRAKVLRFLGRGATSLRSAEHHTLGSPPCEGFAGALTDEVALDLGRQTEGKGQHLALNVVAQTIVVFDRPHATLLRHAEVENLHNHKEVAPQARELTANDGVAGHHAAEQSAEGATRVGRRAADGFFDPTVDVHTVGVAKAVDLIALVFDGLLVAAHADIAVNHRKKIRK